MNSYFVVNTFQLERHAQARGTNRFQWRTFGTNFDGSMQAWEIPEDRSIDLLESAFLGGRKEKWPCLVMEIPESAQEQKQTKRTTLPKTLVAEMSKQSSPTDQQASAIADMVRAEISAYLGQKSGSNNVPVERLNPASENKIMSFEAKSDESRATACLSPVDDTSNASKEMQTCGMSGLSQGGTILKDSRLKDGKMHEELLPIEASDKSVRIPTISQSNTDNDIQLANRNLTVDTDLDLVRPVDAQGAEQSSSVLSRILNIGHRIAKRCSRASNTELKQGPVESPVLQTRKMTEQPSGMSGSFMKPRRLFGNNAVSDILGIAVSSLQSTEAEHSNHSIQHHQANDRPDLTAIDTHSSRHSEITAAACKASMPMNDTVWANEMQHKEYESGSSAEGTQGSAPHIDASCSMQNHESVPGGSEASAALDRQASRQASSKPTEKVKGSGPKYVVLIPCRHAMKGRFPLHGTYFQTNEVFIDGCNILAPRLQVTLHSIT